MLETCQKHLAREGQALVERIEPVWAMTATAFSIEHNGVATSFQRLNRQGPVIEANMTYRIGSEHWTHHFTLDVLSDDQLRQEFDRAGLRWLGIVQPGQSWVAAGTQRDGQRTE